jgi:hypothetical protein
MMKQIKNFFYPNKGILGVFAVWAILAMFTLFFNPVFSSFLEDPVVLLIDVVFNLIVIYFLSCLSIWVYEKIKKK